MGCKLGRTFDFAQVPPSTAFGFAQAPIGYFQLHSGVSNGLWQQFYFEMAAFKAKRSEEHIFLLHICSVKLCC